jgi:hypothetical protein
LLGEGVLADKHIRELVDITPDEATFIESMIRPMDANDA